MRTDLSARSMIRLALISSLSSAVLLATPASADDAAPAALSSGSGLSMDDVLRRLEQLEQRNASLEGEVKTLRESEGETWLTEQRAAQIREVVNDTLADANTRASLQASGMTAGWDDGFFVASPDGRFKLEVGGMMQFRYIYGSVRETPIVANLPAYWADGTLERRGFDLPATQLWLSGHVFGPGLTYKIKGDFTNDDSYALKINPTRPAEGGSGIFTLRDAWLRMELDHNWFVRAGQFRLPFLREELVDPQYQLAVDRSIASSSLGLGYSQGIELSYVSDYIRAQMAFSEGGNDQVGGQAKLVGSLPGNRPWNVGQNEWAFTSRVEWKPFGEWSDFTSFTSPPGSDFGLLIGAAVHYQSTRLDYGRIAVNGFTNHGDNEWLNMSVDATMNFGGASLFGSFTYSYIDSEAAYYGGIFNLSPPTGIGNLGSSNKWAMVLQGAMYVTPKVELFTRYELGQLTFGDPTAVNFFNIEAPGVQEALLGRENHLHVISAGVNWYLDGHDVKFTGDVGYALDSVGPSWFAPQSGWRVSQVRDEWVARLRFQLLF